MFMNKDCMKNIINDLVAVQPMTRDGFAQLWYEFICKKKGIKPWRLRYITR